MRVALLLRMFWSWILPQRHDIHSLETQARETFAQFDRRIAARRDANRRPITLEELELDVQHTLDRGR